MLNFHRGSRQFNKKKVQGADCCAKAQLINISTENVIKITSQFHDEMHCKETKRCNILQNYKKITFLSRFSI